MLNQSGQLMQPNQRGACKVARHSFNHGTSLVVANRYSFQDVARSCTKANASLRIVDLLERIVHRGFVIDFVGRAPRVLGMLAGERPGYSRTL